MIQAANSHVRRLLTEKAQLEEELQAAKDVFKGRMQNLLMQCNPFAASFKCMREKLDEVTPGSPCIIIFVLHSFSNFLASNSLRNL